MSDVKLSQIASGGNTNPATDQIVVVRNGTTDVLVSVRISPRVVTAAGAVTIVASDDLVVINKTVGAATTVNLPSSPTAGDKYTIKDGKGDAATNNITIFPASGTIDGASTFVIGSNYGAAVFQYNGVEWSVL